MSSSLQLLLSSGGGGTLPVNTVLPTLTISNPQVGSGISVSTNGTWTGIPAPTFTYQWYAGGVLISGATSTMYTPVSGDSGKVLKVAVIATNPSGAVTAFSADTSVVAGVPTASGTGITISGTAKSGQVLTASNPAAAFNSTLPITNYIYRWVRWNSGTGFTTIANSGVTTALTSTYTLTAAEVGFNIYCYLTAKNSVGWSAETGSNPTAVIGAAPVTVTLTSSQTWTCPAGITSINLYGKGQDGASDSNAGAYVMFTASREPVYTPNNPYLDWSTIYSGHAAAKASVTAGSYLSSSFVIWHDYPISAANKWADVSKYTIADLGIGLSSVYVVSAPGATYNYGAAAPTSGNVTSAFVGGYTGWGADFTIKAPGGAGAATTGFGKTFAGGGYSGTYPNGVGGTGSSATYNSVTVTPGTGYPLTIPSGGSIQITY